LNIIPLLIKGIEIVMLPLEMLPLPRTGILKSKLGIDLIISISSSTIPSISILPSLAIAFINLSKLSMLTIIL
jgi:hypothetical protein